MSHLWEKEKEENKKQMDKGWQEEGLEKERKVEGIKKDQRQDKKEF